MAVFILIRFLFQLHLLENLEHKAQDMLFRIRGSLPVTDSVVIVAIDDETYQDYRALPFPREIHARLIRNLNLAGARQIIFDLEFTEVSSPYADSVLAETAALAGNVIFAGKFLTHPQNPDQKQILTPIHSIFNQHLNWGTVNVPMDWDGYIREYSLYENLGRERYYSLGVAALANSRVYRSDWKPGVSLVNRQLKVAGHSIPIARDRFALINYFGPAGTFKHIPYSQVIDDSSVTMAGLDLDAFYGLAAAGAFRGKTVLIGATVEEEHDKFDTPFLSSNRTSGVEIHANFLEMVRQRKYLYRPNPWLFLLIELSLAIGLFFLLSWLRPQWSIPVALALVILFFLTALFLFFHFYLLIAYLELVLLTAFLYVAALVVNYLKAQKEKKFIKNAFQQYLAPELVEELIRHPQSLKYGGSMQEITVLFSDIRSFTAYADKHKPEETVLILKEYLTAMADTIIRNSGIVDKFVGDEIMALYGTPVPHKDHALQACKTALEMRSELSRLQEKWKQQGRDGFDIGIGINTGVAVVGNLGSEQIFDYTAIGDTVNLGARLEGLNKEYDTALRIIITQSTYDQVKDKIKANFLADANIRGKDQPVTIYELLGLKT